MLVAKVLLWDWRRVVLILGELTVDDIFCLVYCCGVFFSHLFVLVLRELSVV